MHASSGKGFRVVMVVETILVCTQACIIERLVFKAFGFLASRSWGESSRARTNGEGLNV